MTDGRRMSNRLIDFVSPQNDMPYSFSMFSCFKYRQGSTFIHPKHDKGD